MLCALGSDLLAGGLHEFLDVARRKVLARHEKQIGNSCAWMGRLIDRKVIRSKRDLERDGDRGTAERERGREGEREEERERGRGGERERERK